MEILLAGFIDNVSFSQDEFDVTKIDVTGLHYTKAYELPSTADPHLLVLAQQDKDSSAPETLVVEFEDADGNILARNVQPFPIESQKFGYRLVKGNFEVTKAQIIKTNISIPESDKTLTVPLIIKEK
jgi:hypothetical protein